MTMTINQTSNKKSKFLNLIPTTTTHRSSVSTPATMPPFSTIFTLITIIITCTFTPKVQPFKAPILPQDLLPLLPHQISYPILRSLRSATDILPTFVGAAGLVNNSGINWKGSCFYENTAWLELHNKTGSEFGGGTLHIKVYYNLKTTFFFLIDELFWIKFGS